MQFCALQSLPGEHSQTAATSYNQQHLAAESSVKLFPTATLQIYHGCTTMWAHEQPCNRCEMARHAGSSGKGVCEPTHWLTVLG